MAGGGIQGGQAYGATDAAGENVVDARVDVPDVMATLCTALGVDPDDQTLAELGRPIHIAEGKPIQEVLS